MRKMSKEREERKMKSEEMERNADKEKKRDG